MVVCEIAETIPQAMLRNNHKVIFERSNGIRESLERAWKSTLALEVVESAGFPNMKLLFVFSYVHTVIMERNRFRPYGWAEDYEFNDNDLLTIFRS